MVEKFIFPSRGFYIVAQKFGEADFFLEKMRETQFHFDDFSYNLSAFSSAARSITFSLQAVMCKYPNFDTWYAAQQSGLKSNELAKYFVNLRNHMQKVGDAPVRHAGAIRFGKLRSSAHFIDVEGLKGAPDGEVLQLSERYLIEILKVIHLCFKDYWQYIDPSAIFTERGLSLLGWSIEDIEEAFGLPRGWTDVPYNGSDKNFQRLRLLRRQFGGDDLMGEFFEKYGLPPQSPS